MSDDCQPAPASEAAGETNSARLSRRRLLQVVGGATGVATLGLSESGSSATARAQSSEGGQWNQQQKLIATDGDEDDSFGQSVAVADGGTTALIAAFEDEDPNGDRAGSAYVFVKNSGSWSQQQKLSATDGDIDDGFGVSVALSDDGTTAAIGAADIDERDDVEAPGSVYVFTENGGNWTQQQKLTPDDSGTGDSFGESVSVSADGTTALIGASGNDATYIFRESGGTWSQQQKLTATDGVGNGLFGNSVSLSDDGTTALIGDFEVAFIFAKSGESWNQQQKLTTANGSRGEFGSVSIANEGTTALIGALTDENSNGDRAGSAFVFTRGDGSWNQQQKLIATDGDPDDDFGRSVSLSPDGTTAVIGADSDEEPNGDRAGSAYVFTQSDGQWTQQQKLSADSGDSTDFFGRSVSLSDDGMTALIGAPFDEDPNGNSTGSAYVFSRGEQQAPAPGDGGQAPVELSIEAPETVQPGETLTVTAEVTNRDVPEPTSGAIELTTVPDPLSVTGENPVFLGVPGGTQPPTVGESVSQPFELDVPEQAGLEQELTLEAEASLQNSEARRTDTATQPVTIAEQQPPVERFDQNGEPGIQGDEVLDAISEFNEGGDVEATDVLDVISAFNENSG